MYYYQVNFGYVKDTARQTEQKESDAYELTMQNSQVGSLIKWLNQKIWLPPSPICENLVFYSKTSCIIYYYFPYLIRMFDTHKR